MKANAHPVWKINMPRGTLVPSITSTGPPRNEFCLTQHEVVMHLGATVSLHFYKELGPLCLLQPVPTQGG